MHHFSIVWSILTKYIWVGAAWQADVHLEYSRSSVNRSGRVIFYRCTVCCVSAFHWLQWFCSKLQPEPIWWKRATWVRISLKVENGSSSDISQCEENHTIPVGFHDWRSLALDRDDKHPCRSPLTRRMSFRSSRPTGYDVMPKCGRHSLPCLSPRLHHETC